MCLHTLANPFRGPVILHHFRRIEAEDGTLRELQRSASCIRSPQCKTGQSKFALQRRSLTLLTAVQLSNPNESEPQQPNVCEQQCIAVLAWALSTCQCQILPTG